MLKPYGKKLLVKVIEEPKTKSGIILPENMSNEAYVEVLVVGEKDKDSRFDIEIGDRLLVNKHAPRKINHEGETFYLINYQDILGVCE